MMSGGRPADSGEVTDDVLSAVRDHLARTGAPLSPERVAQALRDDGRPIGDLTVLAVNDALRREVEGAGLLEPLLAAPHVTDVLVNGAGQVWVDEGAGLALSELRFPDDAAVRRLAQRLAAIGGRRLDDASPYVDLRLPDGTRFHAVLSPVARPGTALSLRVPRRRVFSLADLEHARALSTEGAALLRRIVARRLAFLVSGGTGSGKTTVLNALLTLCDPAERILLVEDSSELRPEHPHVVGLEARPPNIEGSGEITVRTLVRQALRMRPDRLVVGEVRGAEVVDLLAALNTGHEGGCGTVHANSVSDVPNRIASLAMAAGLPREAALHQLGSAVDLVLHLHRERGGVRRLRDVGVLVRSGPDVEVVPAVTFDRDLVSRVGPGLDRLEELLDR